MSREALLDLASELDRLLAAGARSAAGSDGLRRRAKVVEELAIKVPALVPLKEAIDRVLSAPAKDAPVALLDLLTRARQMRAGLGNSVTPGDIGTVPPRDGCKTPLTTRRAHELHDTFHGSGGKQEAIQTAIREGEIYDLRLQQTLIDALEDKDAVFAEMVSKDALPKLATAVLGDLVADLELAEGDASDARRLQSICLIDAKLGAELARKALKEGSVKLVTQALESLPGVAPSSEAEAAGLEYVKDKRASVRAAALKALWTSRKAEALDAVFAATRDKSDDVVATAYGALAMSEHPETVTRIMVAVTEQLGNLTKVAKVTLTKKLPANVAKKPAKGKATKPAKVVTQADADAAQRKRWEELNGVSALLSALARRPDIKRADVAEFILPLLDHKEHHAANAAQEVLLGVGPTLPKLLPRIKKLIESNQGWRLLQFVEMIQTAAPKVRDELLPALVKSSLKGYTNYQVLVRVAELLREADARTYAEYVESLLASKEHWRWSAGINQLRAMPEAEAATYLKKAVEGYLHIMGFYTGGNFYDDFLFLIRRDDPTGAVVVPRLCKALTATKKPESKVILLRLLETLGSLAAAARPTVEKLLKGSKKDVKEQIEKTLTAIGTV